MYKGMKVAVVGVGYVGLGTTAMLAHLGHNVIGLDIDVNKINGLLQGETPLYEPNLTLLLRENAERIRWTTNYEEAVPDAEVIFICVDTPNLPSGEPNLHSFVEACQSVIGHLSGKTQVVVNKSTVPVGTGNWFGAFLQKNTSECYANQCSFVANPEFLRQGTAIQDSLYPDRIVLGSDQSEGILQLNRLYARLIDQSFEPPSYIPRPKNYGQPELILTDISSAEMVKYAANAFLAVKISFANEIAGLCEHVGANVDQVMLGIGSDTRIGPRFLSAGVGWGGSCFGKDSAALMQKGREYGYTMPIISAAVEVNRRQRALVISKLRRHLQCLKGKRVAILGMAFKPGTDDLRDAPSHDCIAQLSKLGAHVVAHDPVAMPQARQKWQHLSYDEATSIESALQGADGAIVMTEWDEYRALNWEAAMRSMRTPLVIDARGVIACVPTLGIVEYIGKRTPTIPSGGRQSALQSIS